MKNSEEMLTENKTIYIHQSDIDVYNAMATDEYLLQCVSSGKYSSAIHIYSWSQPCITLGRFTPSDILKKPCNIDVTRRITGGNILYHENDIAYSVVTKLDDNKNIGLELCRRISEIVQRVFSEFHIKTELILKERNLNNRRVPCNETLSRCELVYTNEKKIAASAQKNNRSAILQQGAIYLNHEPEKINKYLNQPTGSIINTFNKLNVNKNTFMQKLGILLVKEFGSTQNNTDSYEEQMFINDLINNKYRTDEWIWQNFN